MLCDTPPAPKLEPLKWEGVSFVDNISYCENGMTEWSEFNLPETIDIPHILTSMKVRRYLKLCSQM